MKIKSHVITLLSSLCCLSSVNAATVIITNANDGLTDTLYANESNVLLSAGVVSTGYFAASVNLADIDTIPELFAALGGFTTITSRDFGLTSLTLGGIFAGYADQFSVPGATSIGPVNAAPLLNRVIYTIVTDAATLGGATLTSGFALFQSGVLSGDTPNEVQITVSPPTSGAIIGGNDTVTGNFGGQGSATFNTLTLASVPEPSTALLGALGILALLRRRR